MHGGRAGDPVVGAGKGVKTIGCDREHEEHEALVEHFQVHTFGYTATNGNKKFFL